MKSPRSIIVLSIISLAVCIPPMQTPAQKRTAKAKAAAAKAAATPTPTPTPIPTPAPTPERLERLEVTAAPSQIAIAAIGGGIEKRNVVITANGPVEGINLTPIDLGRSDDRGIVIPATAITIEPSAHQLKSAEDSLVVPLSFDLRGARSGEFNGVVLVQYKGGKMTIPVTVTVKDRWALPLVMLALGFGLSVIVTYFRENGRSRDEMLLRISQVRSRLNAEPEMDEIFLARIDGLLKEANAGLQMEKWDEAEKALELAETVLDRWQRGRGDWRFQFNYRQELINWLKEFGDPEELPPYLHTVHRRLNEAGFASPNLSGPDQLQQKLESIVQQLNNYTQLHNRILTLESMVDCLERPPIKWRDQPEEWQGSLNNLLPEETAAYDALRADVEAGIDEVQNLVAQGPATSPRFHPGREMPPLSAAPPARLLEEDQTGESNQRLKWVRRATYALAVLLLAGAGFAELYVTQPTFGATRWSDYFTLIAWGFGVEATRASVIGLIRNWGLPGMK